MSVDGSVAAKDKHGRTVFRVFESVLNFYLGAAAPKAINYFGRHVWMKQRSCDHEEEEEEEEEELWTAAALGCADSLHDHW